MIERIKDALLRLSLIFTNTHKKSRWQRYSVPIIASIVVISIKIILHSVLSEYTYHLLPLIVVVSALYGGMGPGLLATVIAVFLDTFVFLLPGVTYFDIDNIASSILLALVGFIISILSEAKQLSDKQKDEFIGFASHELKNPLTAVQGYAQLLKSNGTRLAREKVMSYADSIEDQVKRATDLINELLDVTKIETGKLSYNDEKFSVFDVVKKVVNDQRVIYPEHTIRLNGTSRKKVFADKYRIEQILINLLTNAVKYSPNSKRVLVSLENKRNGIIISIQDFGKGISEENMKRVFEPYFREHVVSNGNIQGLGLGLYISQQIVRHYSGKLWVKSKEGFGSTFYLSLPTVLAR